MSSSPRNKRSAVQAIKAGIACRGFQIITTVDDIPGCHGSKGEKLDCALEFARENGWHVTIHQENGWLLFTPDPYPANEQHEEVPGRLAELMAHWLMERRLSPKTAPAHARMPRRR
jgi:hypothetical protein